MKSAVLVVCLLVLVFAAPSSSVRSKADVLPQNGPEMLKQNAVLNQAFRAAADKTGNIERPGKPWIVPTDEKDWEACAVLPILQQTCVEVYVFTNNLTVGIKLLVQNRTVFNEVLVGDKVCLDDASLLELLTYIPALLPFKAIIDYLIEALGFIPAEVFSLCLEIQNLNITNTQATGCVDLDTVLMCWEDHCLFKGTTQFGCFDIKF